MIWYVVVINTLSFFLYGIDKYLAMKKKYRISEYRLLLLSFLGGSIGAILGMKIFHHKTKKISFWIWNILFLITYFVILYQ